ncbi:MAG: hypothetical protein JW827_11670, partial [Spirochaetes bacterium]|nr:hypothetical protein [Spirochaetota bacterium]
MRLMNIKKIIFAFVLIVILNSFILADSITVDILNLTNHQSTNKISFGKIPAGSTYILAPMYLKISYSNSLPDDWSIQLYTYNTQSLVPGGQHGGLIETNTKNRRAPLRWQVYTNTNTGISFPDATGWGTIKDKKDTDYSTSIKERVIASNGSLGAYPDPAVSAQSPLYLYLGANFSNQAAGVFRTTLFLDILPFSTFTVPPGITHEPITGINIIGNKYIFYADIADDDIIDQVDVFYKKAPDTSFQQTSFFPGSPTYRLKGEIPLSFITTSGFNYYIRATDLQSNQTNTQTYTIPVNPVKTAVIGKSGGDIEMIDGNPEDGRVNLSILPNTFEIDQTITFRQIYNQDEMLSGTGLV